MARVERFTSKEQIPVQQAQLIDPGAFRFSTAGAEAFKAIGGVLEELGKRKRDAQDRIGITDANAIMDNAEREYAKRIIGKPLTEHEAIRVDELNKAKAKVSQLNLSPDAREIVNSNANIKADRFSDIAELVNIQATNKDALIKTSEAYETALIEKDVDSITESEVLLDEQLKNMPAAEAAKFKMELEERAVKQMEQNAKQAQMDLAAINPNSVKTAIDTELKARAKGKKPSSEFALLSNTDLEAVRDYANSVGEKAKTDSEVAATTALEGSYAKIIGGDTDIAAMITSIQADPAISGEDSIKATDKITTFFSKWSSTKVADESDEDIYDELTQASEAVERGTMSPAAFEELYADKKGELDKDDQRTIRSKDIVATKTMQNRTFSDAMAVTRPTLVELTESDLGALKLARQNAEIIKDIATVNFFNIAIKKNQAERWNFGRFRKELRSQISQNPEWSQKQIFTAQEVLSDQLDMPIGQLLKEFDAQNPDKAIMKTPPDIDFKDIWPDLSIDDKAKIWELRMRGAPKEVILGEIKK